MIVKGLEYLQKISNIENSDIGSPPVRVCFCNNGQPDCTYQPEPEVIQKGTLRLTKVPISLAALDQIERPLENAVIYNRLSSGYELCQHHIKTTDGNCSIVEFAASSNNDTEELILFTDGPCKETPDSWVRMMLKFHCPKCPIGFELLEDEEGCHCDCDSKLLPHISNCSSSSKTFEKERNVWITYINTTDNSGGYQYLIYPFCPLDYCHPSSSKVKINLNIPNGADTQCANHRSGLLCGTCKPGLSVSLGSSHCLQCPTYWPGLLVTIVIVFILSGIGLVALLLVLNLTVAIGTLNAIIFYANILAANKSASSGVTFASVFISWLNFDIGIDTCFFDGMDTFVKTWLQLAFPAFIFFIVFVVIKLSYHFTTFGQLIGKKDPVATLATLILLSYTKLLQIIITAFSSAYLNYPDGSKKMVWLPDATIGYLTSKHAVLFITAILVLLVGFAYTILLFSWQWLVHCPRKQVKWIRIQKLNLFLETYHAPYVPQHRYWTGLLLLVRVSVYLISASNPSGDPRVTLSSMVFLVGCLFLYMVMFRIRVYKNWFINAMETFTYFNIIALSIFTWYTFDTDKNQVAITNISIGIIFTQLLVVICYHTLKCTNHDMFSRIQETAVCKRLKDKFKSTQQNRYTYQPLPDDDIHELLNATDCPANTNDCNVPQVHPKPVEPTHSVLELPEPHIAPLPPLEVINEQETEPQQQPSEQDDITQSVAEESQSSMIDEGKQCLNNCSEIEIAESDTTSKYLGTKSTHASPQDNGTSSKAIQNIKMPQSNHNDLVNLSSQQDASGELEKAAPPTAYNCTVKVESHND